jgi:hypothetical protein
MNNTLEHSYGNMVKNIVDTTGISYFFKLLLSRFHYSASATHGLLLFASVILIAFMFNYIKNWYSKKTFESKDRQRDDLLFTLTLFCFLIFFAGISIPALNNISGVKNNHGTVYLYGRYHEYFPIQLIVMGLYFIFTKDYDKKTMASYIKLTGVLYLSLTTYVQVVIIPHVMTSPLVKETLRNSFLHIISVMPYAGQRGARFDDITNYNLLSLGLICVTVFIFMLYFFIRKDKRYLSMVILAIAFGYSSFYGVTTVLQPLSAANYKNFYVPMENLVNILKPFNDIYDRYPTLYVVTNNLGTGGHSSFYTRSRAQIAFNKYNVRRAMKIDEFNNFNKRENSIIISEKDHKLEADDAYQKIFESKNAYIWVFGEDIKDYYNRTLGNPFAVNTPMNAN